MGGTFMQQFNYHTHTYRCGHADLDVTDEDYIKEFIKMGFKEIAFTDHCPEKVEIDKRTNMRMKYTQKDEYLDSIKNLKEKYKDVIEIKTGFEVEYLPDDENNLMELKKESDKLILGQHFIYDNNHQLKIIKKGDFTDEELIRYANYIEKAMHANIPDIIAHPDLYMLNKSNFRDIDEKVANMICSSAEKYNIPLEINLNNIFAKTYFENRVLNDQPIEIQKEKLKNVFYPCKEFWKIATKYNIKVLYGMDVHHKGQILLFNELVSLATEILGEDIINSLSFLENN
jgi:histidinol-phosphatase (PHP family)